MAGTAQEGVDLLPHQRPPVLDTLGRRALLTPWVAAFFWAAAHFREQMSNPLDPVALLLRLLALSSSLRVLLALSLLLRRARELARLSRYQLALSDEGLLLRTPRADFALAKEDVVDIRERGACQNKGDRRRDDVYAIARPASGRLYLAIPPLFAHSIGALAERLMRWRGAPPESAGDLPVRKPSELPSKLFDAVAAGERPPGVAVIEHGRGWMARGPYATVLLGVALLEGFFRADEAVRERFGFAAPLVVGLCLVIVPLFWIAQTRRNIAPRKGIALILTPAELLLRTRAGVMRIPFSEISRFEITSRTVWSILEGAHESRTLVIHRKQAEQVNYAEAFLGEPAEVVLALCEGYRKGALP